MNTTQVPMDAQEIYLAIADHARRKLNLLDKPLGTELQYRTDIRFADDGHLSAVVWLTLADDAPIHNIDFC